MFWKINVSFSLLSFFPMKEVLRVKVARGSALHNSASLVSCVV